MNYKIFDSKGQEQEYCNYAVDKMGNVVELQAWNQWENKEELTAVAATEVGGIDFYHGSIFSFVEGASINYFVVKWLPCGFYYHWVNSEYDIPLHEVMTLMDVEGTELTCIGNVMQKEHEHFNQHMEVGTI